MSEVFTIFPVFLLVDVSVSMSGEPLAALNRALPEMKREMESNPTVGEIARISVITFSDTARTLIPLADLADVELPEVTAEGNTNFAAAFYAAKAAINDGVQSLPKGSPIYRPVVFFMSDGEHNAREPWEPALRELRDRASFKFAPEVVAFGLGDANEEALKRIATRFAFKAKGNDPALQVREILHALTSSIVTTSTSFHDPAQADGLRLDVDADRFTQLDTLST